jgi:hypothetical protein
VSAPDARQRLAAAQAELVRALTGGAEIPAGFDAERVRRAVRSLVNKRLAEVARMWPALVAALGDAYPERFRAFAASTPPPEQGGPLADGRAFAATLTPAEWTDAAVLERLTVDLHFRWTGTGLRARRWFALRWVRLPQSRRLVVRLRLPGGRVMSLWG